MPIARDVFRDLLFFRRTHLAVAAGCAVAAAVLAGALLVGDSVRSSLRQLTLERLGGVDHALAASRFFDESAAEVLAEQASLAAGTAPAILLRATAQNAATKARASDVGLQGVDARFFELYDAEDPLAEATTAIFPPVVVNLALADSLGVDVGSQVLISLQRWSEVPSGSLLARGDTASVVETLRLEVASILPNEDLGGFGLQTHQTSRFNAFVRLRDLQHALDQEGTVNSMLVASTHPSPRPDLDAAWAEVAQLQGSLDAALGLGDFGVRLKDAPNGTLVVESSEYVISPSLEEAVFAAAESVGAPVWPLLTYLGNSIELTADDGDSADAVPYSTLTAADLPATASPFGTLLLIDGSTASPLEDGVVYVHAWTAERLGLDVSNPDVAEGERIRLRYFEVGPREELNEVSRVFDLAGILAMEGLAIDAELSQEYPGIAGSTNMADWDPPFPIELGRIGTADESYWDEYRGAPKVWVGLDQGQALWQTRWGRLTTVRLAPPQGASPATFRSEFSAALLERLKPEAFGLQFQPVKALGVDAAAGPTDFGQLFLSMSFFVIVSAALLVALLFGLGVEQRAGEVGLRLAVGFPPAAVRKLLLVEGLILAAVGGVVGLAGAVGYAALLMLGLRTWWQPAVGTSRLELFVQPTSLVVGWIAALAVVAITIALTVRRVGKVATPQLLSGSVEPAPTARAGRLPKITALLALAAAAAGLAYAFATGRANDPGIFFAVGPTLLVGLLALFTVLLDRPMAGLGRPGAGALLRMAILNSRRNRRRSLLSVTLIAFATFLIVTVAAFEEGFHDGALGMDSGAGGYDLVAEADVPLQQNLADAEGRFELGLPGIAEAALADSLILPFRLRPGDDTSCLNLYKPGDPRILGVPEAQIERGGFVFAKLAEGFGDIANPWTLLQEELEGGVVPMIGDANSTQWILRLPVGGEMTVDNDRGEAVTLRLMATLATSVFQSELLISEEQFLRHFPNQGGYPYFLIDTPDGSGTTGTAETVSTALEAGLDRYGFDAVGTGEKLASFHAVQNTYLSTFRSLGGLGLLLGTLGLAVVLMRNVIERRGELATLRAFGYRRKILRRLIVLENAALLVAGLAIGTVAALLTAGPKVFAPGAHPPWGPILGTLGLIFVFGLVACAAAAHGALAAELMPALKSEA